jgi:hypothetical protein
MQPTSHSSTVIAVRAFTILCLSMALAVIHPAAGGDLSQAAPKFGPKWRTLIGEWKGQDNSGAPSGACGFHLDLADPIIVRTNLATLPGAAAPHTDLMIISPESTGDKASAAYWDNEGHIINYAATWASDGNTLTFVSKPGPGPQFRLIYKKADSDSFTVNFEMAPPGQTTFRPYASGKISRH